MGGGGGTKDDAAFEGLQERCFVGSCLPFCGGKASCTLAPADDIATALRSSSKSDIEASDPRDTAF